MKPLLIPVLCLALVFVAPAMLAEDADSTSTFLQTLSEREGFTLTGLAHVRDERFKPPSRETDTDRLLSLALARYNYLVSYRGGRVSRVDIFGRKGRDVGALPEEVADSTPPDQPDEPDELRVVLAPSRELQR